MNSRILAGLLAAVCVSAAAGGAYMAVRQNDPAQPVAGSPTPASAPAPAAAKDAPVEETEAIVTRPDASQSAGAPAAKPAEAAEPTRAPVPAPDVETTRAAAKTA